MNETILMLMLALIMIIFFIFGLNGLRVKKRLEESETAGAGDLQKQARQQ